MAEYLLNKEDSGMRIIAISDKEGIIRDYFNGIVIDKIGTIKVGGVSLHPNEIGHFLAQAVMYFNDALKEITGKKGSALEEYSKNLFTDPRLTSYRQTLLEIIVKDERENPIIDTSKR